MAHSENKNPWFRKPYVQHYDDAGNEIGKTFDKKNILTNKVKKIHTDQNNNKIGSSENVKDAFTGKSHTQHFDQNGNPTNYTETKKNFFGKYKPYTKSGKKRTTQEYLAIITIIGLVIYFIVKVVLPLAFVLTTPVITLIALVNIIKAKDETYFKYSLICSTLFIIDYLFKGYSSYLMADSSFIAENLFINLGIAFVCFGLSIVLLFYNQLNQILLKFNIENINVRKSIVGLLFLFLLIPFYFIDNKFLLKSAMDKVTAEKPNLDQPTVDNSSVNKSPNEKPSLDQPKVDNSNLNQSKMEQPNKSNTENGENNKSGIDTRYYPNGKIMSKGKQGKGEYFEYFENGQLKAKENYLTGAFNGDCFYYYENGNLRLKVSYTMSALNGELIKYYENGQIKAIQHFEAIGGLMTGSKQVGEWIEYYDNGQIKEKGNYVNDKRKGEWIVYNENGQIKEKMNYGD